MLVVVPIRESAFCTLVRPGGLFFFKNLKQKVNSFHALGGRC
jgi:hypothetical protein